MISRIKPSALLLDLDGTLANSLSVMRQVYDRFLQQFNAKPTEIEFTHLNGPPLPEVVRSLKTIHTLPGSLDDLIGRYYALLDQAYAEVRPNPGAMLLLEKARHHDCTVAIVTSNSAHRTWGWLEQVDLACLVSFVTAEEDIIHGKPHPEPYLLAAEQIKCPISEIVAVEDSLLGARSASDAGLMTFVLENNIPATHWPNGVERVESLKHLAERLW